jgi:hypothetical protein
LKIVSFIFSLLITAWWIGAWPAKSRAGANTNHELLELSGKLLHAVKTGTPTDSIEKNLAALKTGELLTGLNNDTARKVFWINIYNAWYQMLAVREQKTKLKIFTGRYIRIAGLSLSLDNIEHGILRRYRWKYSMGYLPQFWPRSIIKKLAVSSIDYRIHFALNCGAKSCPPIAFYTYENLDKQLNLASTVFLKSETTIDSVNKNLTTSRILSWFKADFGGLAGIRKKLSAIFHKDFSDYRVSFKNYDWTAQLKNFQQD